MCNVCEQIEEILRLQGEVVLPKGKKYYLGVRLTSEVHKGRKVVGSSTYRTQMLNFCPECGKKVSDDAQNT